MATGWTYEGVIRRIGKPAGWVPPTVEETEAAFDAAIDLLRAPTRSGYSEVYPVGSRWQAKPYVKPGSQRSAGYFSSPRAAAMQVFMTKMGYEPWPPSPKKGMNKHGQGRKPVHRQRSRISKGGSAFNISARASPLSVTASLMEHGEESECVHMSWESLSGPTV